MSREGSNPSFSVTYSTIAQLVERMTVNHDVTGSSPVGGVWMGILFKRAEP